MGGHNGMLDRGERETRGERRGSGERLPSGSRFAFPYVAMLLLLAAPAAGQGTEGADAGPNGRGIRVGLRVSGVASTRLVTDAMATAFPDTGIFQDVERDTVFLRAPIAPDLTLVVGLPMSDELDLELAAGYTLGSARVDAGDDSRDAGPLRIGHAVLSVTQPMRGFRVRVGAGAAWFHGSDLAALDGSRTVNPLLELAGGRRWRLHGYDLDAALVGQGMQVTSDGIEARRGSPGLVYRLALELGVGRRFGR